MKKRCFSILLVLLFLAGLCVLLYPIAANFWNSKVQTRTISNYRSVLKSMEAKDYSRYFEAADAFNQKLLQMDLPLYHAKELGEYPELLKVPGTEIMGCIAIDKLQIELPIYHGTSPQVLAAGVGHLEGTSLPVGGEGTHCVLSAHRGLPSSKLFSDLDKMEVGDCFTITVLDRLITYQVDEIKIVLPKELDDLAIAEGEDRCTLVTCTPYGINTHRLLVRGTRVENAETKPQIQVFSDAVPIDPLAVAPIAAVPMLVLVLLFIAFKYRKRK